MTNQNNQNLLIREMAEQCGRLVSEANLVDSEIPPPLQSEHLCWMCDQIKRNAERWPTSRIHRWIGFIQCALLVNRVLDLDGLNSMFDKAKVAYGDTGQDLLDHLNPEHPFELDLGGHG